MRSKKLFVVAILLLGIGFAAVSTTLILTGNVTIATNDTDFDVIFTKATSEEGATAAISPDGKNITFGTSNLTTVGDISILDFEVTNNSEMYDAEVSIECSATGDKSSYYEITKELATPIVAKTTGTGKVEVKLLKATVEDIREEFICTLTVVATERTEKAKEKYRPKYFAYGWGDIPTVESTQDYKTLGKNVFAGLDEKGQKSVCTLATGSLECFKSNNVAEEQEHVKRVFGESNCSGDSDVHCSMGDFRCNVLLHGTVDCGDNTAYCLVDGVIVSCD